MGTLALDRDSMGLVRKAQRLYYQEGKEPSEICASLGISLRAVARAITYPTHFFSVYDLQGPDDDGDIFERLASTRLSGSAEDAVIRMVTMECLREEFLLAFQERPGHSGFATLACTASPRQDPAGDRCAEFAEGVRCGKSQGSGNQAAAGSVSE